MKNPPILNLNEYIAFPHKTNLIHYVVSESGNLVQVHKQPAETKSGVQLKLKIGEEVHTCISKVKVIEQLKKH